MAEFPPAIISPTNQYRTMPQEGEVVLSHTKVDRKVKTLIGIQHITNTETIAIAIFNTFLCLFARRFSVLTDCSPETFCVLSLKE